MNNKEFKAQIKKITNKEIDVPSAIIFSFDTTNLKLTLDLSMESLTSNMQEDASAIEGWALVIVGLLKESNVDIKNIEIKTNVRIDEINDYIHNESGDNGRLHLNRLFYRLTKFYEQYKSIFNITITNLPIGMFSYYETDGRLRYKDMSEFNLCVNAPDSESTAQIKHANFDEMSETEVELSFVKSPKILFNKMKNVFGKTYDVIDRQLPVGLFDGVKSDETYITTGKKSAIDLWALSESKDQIVICELKKKSKDNYNQKVGIISELYFYVNVMHDVFVNKSIAQTENLKSVRSYSELLNNKSISSVDGVFLVDKLHPLITNEVIRLLNKNSKNNYSVIVYDESYLV